MVTLTLLFTTLGLTRDAILVSHVLISWRLDLFSVGLGLLLGLAATYGLAYLTRTLKRKETTEAAQRPQAAAWRRDAAEENYHQAVAHLLATRHFARDVAPLERLFVPPRLLAPPQPAHPEKPPPLAAVQLAYLWPDLAARIAAPPLPTVSLRSLLLNAQRVALSAPPGSGKSTLLAYCAYLCTSATPGADFGFLYRHLPIILHLDDLRFDAHDAGEASLAPLQRALKQQFPQNVTRPGRKLLQEKAEAGYILLLLDGWSEVSDEMRGEVASWLRRLLAHYPAISVLVATASAGFEALLDLDFIVSGPAPWRAAEAQRLGQRWAAAHQTLDAPALEEYWQPHQTALETTLRLWSLYRGARFQGPHLPALLQAAAQHVALQASGVGLPAAALESYWQRLAYGSWQQAAVELSPALIVDEATAVADETSAPRGERARLAAALRASLAATPFISNGAGRSLRWSSTLWRDHLAAARLVQNSEALVLRHTLRDAARTGILDHLAYTGSIDGLAAWMLESTASDLQYDDLFRVAGWFALGSAQDAWKQHLLIRLAQLIARPEAADIQRLRAIAALPACNDPGILPLLQQLLQRSDPAIRQMAAAALARFDAPLSVPQLTEMLHDGEADVRIAAAHALGWQQSDLARRALRAVLTGADELLRYAAVEALALGGLAERRALRDALHDEDMHVRRAASHGLALVDEPWAEELLRQTASSDEEPLVQAAAARGLRARANGRRRQPWRPLQASDLHWVVQWRAGRDEAAPGGAAAVTLLCEMLATAPETAIRAAAARSLAHVAIPAEERDAVWASLWQATRVDGSGAVREAAQAALAYLQRARGPQDAYEALDWNRPEAIPAQL